MNHDFHISVKKSLFNYQNYPINIEKKAISYHYIYNYFKNKTVEGMGKPKTKNTKYGLYYSW